MGASFWSFPYADSGFLPYWGAQTSAVNFCEEDYIVSHFVAEFFNTLTSLTYIGYGYHGIQRFKKKDISPFSSVNWPYWSLIGIGIFSGLYHATLKYHTQMADEMSMHLTIGCGLIQLFTYDQSPEVRKRRTTFITVGLASFIVYHCATDEFAMHVALFFTLCVTCIWKTRSIIHTRIQNPLEKERLSALATLGGGLALFAYFLWNIDVHFCVPLTKVKRSLGMPWGILLELHGWWHILTAIAAYIFMALIEFLTAPKEAQTHGLGFAWPAKAVLEQFGLGESKPQNGHAKGSNGHALNSNGHIKPSNGKAH